MDETRKLAPGLRAAIAAQIDALLQEHVDLRTLAREQGPFTRGGLTWHASHVVPAETTRQVRAVATAVTEQAEADLVLWSDNGRRVYMRRWWLERETTDDGRGQHGLYIHRFEHDDPARMHNHPWPCASLLVAGTVIENTPGGRSTIRCGSVCYRPATHRHRVTLRRRGEQAVQAITVIATGTRERVWELEHADGSVSLDGEGRAAKDR